MGTRSRIGVMLNETECMSVYCHWDGYLSYNGRILANCYTDLDTVLQMILLGDMSSLGTVNGVKHPFSRLDTDMSKEQWDAKYGAMTTYYGRDRGETECVPKISTSFDQFIEQAENCGAEYVYVFKDGEWFYSHVGGAAQKLSSVTEALSKETA